MDQSTPVSNQARWGKAGDFLLGLVLLPMINGLALTLFSWLKYSLNPLGASIFALLTTVVSIGLFIVEVWYFRKQQRRYVVMGLAVALVTPLLLFGACIGMLSMPRMV